MESMSALVVTDSLWTVKFNADGKSLKRHEHEEDDDNGDQKRVRFTHKQPVNRADPEVTDDKDTHAKRAKLCDTPSSSSSSHEFAPMQHDSSGVDESAETRESNTKKPRVDDDMEISEIETLTNAKLEVDRALDTANKTLHRVLDEYLLESEAVTEAAELNSIKDKRVYTEMYKSEADAKIISGKWGAETEQGTVRAERLRGRREDVFASTTMSVDWNWLTDAKSGYRATSDLLRKTKVSSAQMVDLFSSGVREGEDHLSVLLQKGSVPATPMTETQRFPPCLIGTCNTLQKDSHSLNTIVS